MPVVYLERKHFSGKALIAYQMNGRDLSQDHGYPVRAIVPGHYAMASVKWLTLIYAVREPFQGYWQTSDYAYWDYVDGKPVRRPSGEIKLKSEIFRPGVYETLAPSQACTVFGAAWAGESEVTEVSISADGGQTWARAEFVDPVQRYAWRRWNFDWVTPKKPGQYIQRLAETGLKLFVANGYEATTLQAVATAQVSQDGRFSTISNPKKRSFWLGKELVSSKPFDPQ